MLKRYIVMLDDDTPNSDIDKIIAGVESAGGKLAHRYDESFKGFSATIPENHLQILKDSWKAGDSKITYIEPVSMMGVDS